MSVESRQRRSAACTPCRGTGQVISNLGGNAHPVVCPWCDGTGEFIAGRDAQASPAERSPAGGATESPEQHAGQTPAESQ